MQPTIGRNVHYQRAGETLHANITRLEPKPLADGSTAAVVLDAVTYALWTSRESNWDVWVAVFIHTPTIGSVEFSPCPIPYDAERADKTWSWPRVP